jgi:saccharopine dehydrogenase-like NADP-dependent oxidoreductase
MQACLKAGLHYLDLGGLQEMTKRQYKLSSSYKRKKLIALLGCGSTPGTSNVMAAYAVMHLDSVKHIELGFAWDSNIKEFVLPYSIESIAHELLTPPIVLQNGKFIKRKACDMEGITMFRAVGKQATYCIVHSEVFTFARYFKKKGLKDVHYRAGFPEHSYRVIEMLLKYGFTSKEPIKVHDVEIRPVDVTRELLKNVDKPKGYKEVEDIWVKVDGMKDGKETRIEMDCVVQTKKGWEEYGSNIDTGMTISIMAQMLHNGLIKGTGVTAPEAVVPPEPFFRELTLRGMQIYLNEKEYLGEKDGIR